MNGWVVLLWSFVAALVLIVGGIFASLLVMGRITLFPEETPTAIPTAEATGVLDPTYSVMILNATGEAGLEAQMRDQLVNSGWTPESVLSGSAGAQDFPDTTVYYILEEDQLAALGVADLLGASSVVQSDYYADPNNPALKQLTVVIGSDLMTTAPDAPAE